MNISLISDKVLLGKELARARPSFAYGLKYCKRMCEIHTNKGNWMVAGFYKERLNQLSTKV